MWKWFKKKKVECGKCKYFEVEQHYDLVIFLHCCTAPENVDRKFPEFINKNNDCRWYDSKIH